jgi:hypothetical protein
MGCEQRCILMGNREYCVIFIVGLMNCLKLLLADMRLLISETTLLRLFVLDVSSFESL